MRIDNNLRANAAGGRTAASRSAGSSATFHVDEGGAPARSRSAAAVAPTASLDALLTLQAVEDPLVGRRRKAGRGRSLLDALDALKADLLVGRIGDGHLNQLAALVSRARERGDPALDAVLDDIELRVRVELAKRGVFPPG